MASPAAVLLLLFHVLYGVQYARGEYNASALSAQIDSLLAEYEREAPPAARVAVLASLDVRHASVDEAHSTMRVLADLKLSWMEPRIGWNVTEWGTEYVLTSAERLWLPDVTLLNAAATSDVGEDALRARLSSEGAVTWISRVDVAAPFAMDLRAWPKDTHACVFKFGSRTLNEDELVLDITDLTHTVVAEAGAWDVKSITGASSRWQRGAEAASVAGWQVRVGRRAPAHAAAAHAALLAVAAMLAAATALPPARRHSLAAAASFTAALWLTSALARLPAGGTCPRVFAVMCAACVAGALAGAGAALAARLARCAAPPPPRLRAALSRLAGLCRLTPAPQEEQSSSGAWAAAALLLDRALCAALLLTLLVLLAVQLL